MKSQARRSAYFYDARGSADTKASYDTVSDVSQTTEASQADTVCTFPAQTTTSSGWSTKRRKHVSFVTPTSQDVHSIEPRHASLVSENEKFRSRAQNLLDSSEVYKSQDLSSVSHLGWNERSKATLFDLFKIGRVFLRIYVVWNVAGSSWRRKGGVFGTYGNSIT